MVIQPWYPMILGLILNIQLWLVYLSLRNCGYHEFDSFTMLTCDHRLCLSTVTVTLLTNVPIHRVFHGFAFSAIAIGLHILGTLWA